MNTPLLRRFTEVTNSTPTGRKSAVRALQAWQILIAKASNRQIIRYEHLQRLMDYPDARPLSTILTHVMHLCRAWKLPPLTVIVVNRDGTPGEGFTDVPRVEFDHWREQVFDENWFNIVPPTVDQFHAAWREATGVALMDDSA